MVKYGDISSYYEAFIAFSSIFIWKSLKGQLSGTHWYGGPHLSRSHSCKVWFEYICLSIYYSSYNSCFIAIMILLMLFFLGVAPPVVFLSNYLHAKNLGHWLIPSTVTDGQTVQQSASARAYFSQYVEILCNMFRK